MPGEEEGGPEAASRWRRQRHTQLRQFLLLVALAAAATFPLYLSHGSLLRPKEAIELTGRGGGGSTSDFGVAVPSPPEPNPVSDPRTDLPSLPTQVCTSTDPDPSHPTLALTEPFFKGGFRNQAMRFHALVIEARNKNISQILLPSVRWGDAAGSTGTGLPILHETLFDVGYWNCFHHRGLPRLVTYDSVQHRQWDATGRLLNVSLVSPLKKGSPTQFIEPDAQLRHHPRGGGGGVMGGKLWNWYSRYIQRMVKNGEGRDRIEVLAYRALKPSPFLLAAMDDMVGRLEPVVAAAVREGDFIVLHARVEPDMLTHQADYCGRERTFNLTEILGSVERDLPKLEGGDNDSFRVPRAALLPLNRRLMEDTARNPKGAEPLLKDDQAEILAENLAALERIDRDGGLWGGRVPVFGMGTAALMGDARFEGMRETAGAAINFFLALRAATFVGTPISTYSVDIW